MRKIVQIAEGISVIVLCDDGSLWKYTGSREKPWYRLPDIPQDQPPAKEAE